MPVASGVILMWGGTNASIPSDWERETTLDDKYPKGHGVENPNITGGSNTHTHTDGGHVHTLTSHTHTYVTGTSAESVGSFSSESGSPCISAHSHSTGTTSATSGGSLQSSTVTWSSVNQEPPYYKVIFIKPSSGYSGMKSGIIAHYNGSTVPSGFDYCDGTNSTPDLRGKYMKGAAAGADAGSGSGATSHVHTVSHPHTANTHTHTGTTPGTSGGSQGNSGTECSTYVEVVNHTHPAYLNAGTANVSNLTKTDAGGNAIDLSYSKMGLIQSNSTTVQVGLVGLWLGAVVDIPLGWKVCDGTDGTVDMTDVYIKVPTTLADNEDTGGSNTHTHSDVSHTHTATGTHTHTGGTSTSNTTTCRKGTNTGALLVLKGWNHTVSSVQNKTATFSSTNITANSVNHEPTYRTAAYVEFAFPPVVPNPILNMMIDTIANSN